MWNLGCLLKSSVIASSETPSLPSQVHPANSSVPVGSLSLFFFGHSLKPDIVTEVNGSVVPR